MENQRKGAEALLSPVLPGRDGETGQERRIHGDRVFRGIWLQVSRQDVFEEHMPPCKERIKDREFRLARSFPFYPPWPVHFDMEAEIGLLFAFKERGSGGVRRL